MRIRQAEKPTCGVGIKSQENQSAGFLETPCGSFKRTEISSIGITRWSFLLYVVARMHSSNHADKITILTFKEVAGQLTHLAATLSSFLFLIY
jgi:hypothetical protein